MTALRLPDIVRDDLTVVFCGINPGLTAAVAGYHFTNRSNRFWRVIHQAGFTPHEIRPEDGGSILDFGCGLTTVVERPTKGADDLSAADFAQAAAGFEAKMRRLSPRFVAFLGKPAYAALTGRRDIAWGRQAAPFAGAVAWVLPNPSGRNRAFSLDALVVVYRELYEAARRE